MTARTDRIDQLLREEIGSILAKDIQDPRIGFVTVTDVETAPDLSTARVWVSVIGQEAERVQTMRALQRAMPFVRHELGSRLHLRRIPELQVRGDDTAQRGTRVLQLLAELEAGGTPVEDVPIGESLPTPLARLPHEGDAEDGAAALASVPAPAGKRSRRDGDRRGERPSGERGAPGARDGQRGHGGGKKRSR
ncbi:MAG TPA: 30S ribosome-binding factor RbfA [Candidatus Limnocylindria bacterium]|nr:30S ribosome-binding factor RbfA [Candidatus Limnocylindria bacterium]